MPDLTPSPNTTPEPEATPETDAESNRLGACGLNKDFAQRLERQRNKARAQLERLALAVKFGETECAEGFAEEALTGTSDLNTRPAESGEDSKRLSWALTSRLVYCRDSRGLIDRVLKDRADLDSAMSSQPEGGER